MKIENTEKPIIKLYVVLPFFIICCYVQSAASSDLLDVLLREIENYLADDC